MELFVLSGLGVGLVFGYALQRGRFCMNSASRDALLLRDYTLLKAVGVALLVQMIGFALLDVTGIAATAPKPFFWGANLVGSFTFGVGMVLAGACASGLTYRTGEGMVSAIVAALGLSVSAFYTAGGFLNPVSKNLQESTIITTAEGGNLTVASLLGIPYYLLALGIAIVTIVVWLLLAKPFTLESRAARTEAAKAQKGVSYGWGWMTTGIVIGLIAIVAFPLSAAAGRNYPLGITDGWIGLVKGIFMGEALGWGAMLIVGIILGALAAALVNREFKFRIPSLGMLVQVFIGGLLMGFGAVCSGGCNIGHTLSGLPQLSIGSIVATLSIIAGAWLTAYLIFNVFRKSPTA
ncbi:MAG: YeeE/YedE family protein [Anaerolineales bacterium]